jgi:hypothetical protein
MENEESVTLVGCWNRANELLTGAFFAHQPWSAQRASGIVEAALDKFRLVAGFFSFFRKTQQVDVEITMRLLVRSEDFLSRLPRFLSRQRETRREEYCGGRRGERKRNGRAKTGAGKWSLKGQSRAWQAINSRGRGLDSAAKQKAVR